MKKLLLLFAALLAFGCGEKSPYEGSESASEYSIPLSDADVERLLKVAVYFDSLQERNDLYYQPNKSKPYSGWVKETYDDSEQAEELFEVQNGKQEGRHIEWDEDGHKRSEENYKNGKRDGLVTYWHRNGQKKGEWTFKDGKPDGPYTTWHENGQKQFEVTYKYGERFSEKYRNSKGEEVETAEEAGK